MPLDDTTTREHYSSHDELLAESARGSPAPAVRAEDLTVVRGPRTVLRGLDFTVPRGQITGLLGPSGCGKSTLMRSIVGTQAKVTGTLEVLGSPAGHPTLRTRIGYVTQAPPSTTT